MIQFIKCTRAQYNALETKEDNFYYLTDENSFYLKGIKLSNDDLSSFLTEIKNGDASITVTDKNKVAVKLSQTTGNILKLNKDGLFVNASDAKDYTVTVTKAATAPEGLAARYTIAQAATGLSQTIDIPKDLVVKSGSVVTDTETGKTNIVLVLNDDTNTELKIDASSLIEYVTAGEDTATVHVNVSADHKVTANVIDGTIGTTQLANEGVTSDKIAANAITSSKLAKEVTDSISKGTEALQASDIKTGVTANGSINVKGTDIAVKGLESAAYTKSSAYATSAQGTKADSALQSANIVSGTTNGSISVKGKDIVVTGLDSAAYAKTTDFDAAGSAATAETNAKSYADTKLTEAKSYTDSALEWKTLA